MTTQSDINAQYPVGSELRKDFIAKKEGSLTSQQSFFTKAKEQSKSAVVASYEVALLLARKKKPFTDAEEIIKPSLKIAARMLGDKKCETKFDQIPLSNNTMARRVEELASDVHRQVATHVKNCKFFSLAMDESMY